MDFGVFMFATEYTVRPDELARAAEERGFESLWFPEHTHIPTSQRSPWPGGGELPEEYLHTHDLFVALSMAAAVTTKLKIGTGICLVIETRSDHVGKGSGNARRAVERALAVRDRWRLER